MIDSIDTAINTARSRLRAAALARLSAEAEYNAAEEALYAVWQSAFGSERWCAARYSEDQRAIKTEVGATW